MKRRLSADGPEREPGSEFESESADEPQSTDTHTDIHTDTDSATEPAPKRRLMAVRGFPQLVVGQFTSSVGDMCSAIALPWVILSSSGGPVLLGLVLAVLGVSKAVLIPVGGIVTDRLGARPVMLVSDLVRCAAVALLAALSYGLTPSLTWLGPIAVVLGAAGGMFVPASFALLPSLLTRDQLPAGNSVSSTASRLGSLLGPGLGGVLITLSGPGPALFTDAATYLVSAATLYWIRTSADRAEEDQPAPDTDTAPKVTFRQVLLQGRFLQVVLVAATIGNLVYTGVSEVALPALAHRDFGAGGYGTLLAGLSAGLIGGSLLARTRTRLRPATLLTVLVAVMSVSVALVPYTGSLAGATACIVVFSVSNGWSGIVIITMLQMWAPPHLLARVMSMMLLAMSGTFPISAALSGWAVAHFGLSVLFPVSGAGIACAILWAVANPSFREATEGARFTGPPAPAVPAPPPPMPERIEG